MFLPREAGEGDHAKHGGGGMRAPERTFSRARELRRQMSLPEIVLWQALRKGRLAGLRFRRQHPVGPYILDFYCASARLAIEVDGLAHDTAAAARHDERRQAWLVERGVTVLRFSAGDVLQDEKLQAVLVAIERALPQPPPARCARHLPRRAGEDPV
jgi:very-short-patch-repair endonuclease